jgi:hypothetical protein
MKKLVIVLMVVAMASFLFVGCLPGVVTPEPTPTPTPTPTPIVKTDTPYITLIDGGNVSLYSIVTEYASGATTGGVSVAGAVIKLYINGVQAGVANSGTGGVFTVTVSMLKLTEGVTKLYVTATVPGLAESDKSTEYTFTVDTTAPKIASAVADSGDNVITVTFNEGVNTSISTTTSTTLTWAKSVINPANWTVTAATFDAGTLSFVATSSKVVRITSTASLAAVGTVFALAVTDICDLLGNTRTTATSYVGAVTD